MSAGSTFRLQPTPSAMLVGLPEPLAARCAAALGDLRIIRVAHVAAACERMPITLPRLAVVVDGASENDLATIKERAIACGVELVIVAPNVDDGALAALLTNAAETAAKRKGAR
jgi:hypothetical protein